MPALNGTFPLYIRVYWAEQAVLDGTWMPPLHRDVREPLIKDPSLKTSPHRIKKWERAEGRKGLRQQSGG